MGIKMKFFKKKSKDIVFEETKKELINKFNFYKTENLKSIDSNEFRKKIDEEIGKIDYNIEGYSNEELDNQRDFSDIILFF